MTEQAIGEFEIHAQEGTTIKVLDDMHVVIEQEAPEEPFGIVGINIRGPHNLDQLIAALSKIREAM